MDNSYDQVTNRRRWAGQFGYGFLLLKLRIKQVQAGSQKRAEKQSVCMRKIAQAKQIPSRRARVELRRKRMELRSLKPNPMLNTCQYLPKNVAFHSIRK